MLAHDWLIVPGERVGPITAASTEAGLRAAFGDAAVVQATIRIDNVTTAPSVEVYRDKPGESLAVVWPRREHGLWWPLLVIPCYGPARLDSVLTFFDSDGKLKSGVGGEQLTQGFLYACGYGRDRVVAFLIGRGVDLAAHGGHGQTGLHWAVNRWASGDCGIALALRASAGSGEHVRRHSAGPDAVVGRTRR